MPSASGISAAFGRRLGAAVKEAGASRMGGPRGGWRTPHSAAAARSILERIPLVDLIVEVRDARIPVSSAFQLMREGPLWRKRIVLLNKLDLADSPQTEKWIEHFKEKNYICGAVNSHNKKSVTKLLSFLRAQIRDLKGEDSNYAATLMLVGIPNVGKSALANSMHQTGRISTAEKGKLKHATVSSTPMETKDISSYKIASHPNIYVLDTPGILRGEIDDAEAAAKVALTGAINDCLVGEDVLAHYFLSILNSDGGGYKCSLRVKGDVEPSRRSKETMSITDSGQGPPQYPSDHTQDLVVRDVRRILSETILSFEGNLENEIEMSRLIEFEFAALHVAFGVPSSKAADQDGYRRSIAKKLLNLFRTGRLGRYTLDVVPREA